MQHSSPTRSSVFMPEAVAAINRAYAGACKVVETEGGRDALRLKLAEHIMFLARNGEADEGRLCDLALTAVLGRNPRGYGARLQA